MPVGGSLQPEVGVHLLGEQIFIGLMVGSGALSAMHLGTYANGLQDGLAFGSVPLPDVLEVPVQRVFEIMLRKKNS